VRRAALLALLALAGCGASPEARSPEARSPEARSPEAASAPSAPGPDPQALDAGPGPPVATVAESTHAAAPGAPAAPAAPAGPAGGEVRAGLDLHSRIAPPVPEAGLTKLGSGTPPQWPKGPSVDFGTVLSSVPISGAERVVAMLRPGFRRCYASALNGDPNLSGAFGLEAKLGPGGETVGVKPTGAKGLPPELLKCLSAVLHTAQFAPPPAGGATLMLPFTMTTQ
jgi:hypothetical protein